MSINRGAGNRGAIDRGVPERITVDRGVIDRGVFHHGAVVEIIFQFDILKLDIVEPSCRHAGPGKSRRG